jgi:hypothetical protein
MEPVREAWTDERLDDLSSRVDDGFRGVRAEFRDVRAEMQAMRSETNARLDAMDARLDGIQRAMIYGFVSLTGAMLAGFGGIAGLIATQL